MIIRNAAQCAVCLDVIQSTHVHDYVSCKCNEISVDGGNRYLRRSANDINNLIELSISTNDPFIPHSTQLENNDMTIAAHHPDTCISDRCALHSRTDHEMRDWEQGLEMVGSTFVMTRTCPHGFIHTDPDDFYVQDFEWCNACKPKHKEVVF
jgi:hypothetical protein